MKKSDSIRSCMNFVDSAMRIGKEVLEKDLIFDMADLLQNINASYNKAIKEEMEGKNV